MAHSVQIFDEIFSRMASNSRKSRKFRLVSARYTVVCYLKILPIIRGCLVFPKPYPLSGIGRITYGVVCSVCCGDRSPPHSSAVRLLVLHGLPGDSAPSIRAHPVTKGSFVSCCNCVYLFVTSTMLTVRIRARPTMQVLSRPRVTD